VIFFLFLITKDYTFSTGFSKLGIHYPTPNNLESPHKFRRKTLKKDVKDFI